MPKPKGSSSRRQDQPSFYFINGSIYTVKVSRFLEMPGFIYDDTSAIEIPQDRSIDIDTQTDFDYASFLIQNFNLFHK